MAKFNNLSFINKKKKPTPFHKNHPLSSSLWTSCFFCQTRLGDDSLAGPPTPRGTQLLLYGWIMVINGAVTQHPHTSTSVRSAQFIKYRTNAWVQLRGFSPPAYSCIATLQIDGSPHTVLSREWWEALRVYEFRNSEEKVMQSWRPDLLRSELRKTTKEQNILILIPWT